MKLLSSRAFLLTACLAGSSALAQDLIENVVVRNRLHDMTGKLEAGVAVGFTVVNRLTDHINVNATFGYNVADTFGVELRGGYALSRHTGVARQIADEYSRLTKQTTDDLADLWEIKANGLFGVRWAPLYGKISLMSELPVHFQAYVWAGGGAGTLERQSLVYCERASAGSCDSFLLEQKVSALGSAALGVRFFTGQLGSIRLELRDYTFPDSYRVGINRQQAERGEEAGTPAQAPGLTNIVLFDVGYAFTF